MAGQCTDAGLLEQIKGAELDRVVLIEGHIPDEDVTPIFEAADVVCLPFKDVTTTGSAILALSYGKPIVAPRVGALRDLPDDVGYFYGGDSADDLAAALRRVITDPQGRALRGAAALAHARSLTWRDTAQGVLEVYTRLS